MTAADASKQGGADKAANLYGNNNNNNNDEDDDVVNKNNHK